MHDSICMSSERPSLADLLPFDIPARSPFNGSTRKRINRNASLQKQQKHPPIKAIKREETTEDENTKSYKVFRLGWDWRIKHVSVNEKKELK